MAQSSGDDSNVPAEFWPGDSKAKRRTERQASEKKTKNLSVAREGRPYSLRRCPRPANVNGGGSVQYLCFEKIEGSTMEEWRH